MNSARTSNYSASSLNQAPLKKRKILKTSLAKHASAAVFPKTDPNYLHIS